jgi:hypothetical protein
MKLSIRREKFKFPCGPETVDYVLHDVGFQIRLNSSEFKEFAKEVLSEYVLLKERGM